MPFRRFVLGAWIASASSLFSHPRHDDPPATPEQTLVETLLSERKSEEALAEVIASARKQGISEQAILEARFLFYVDRQEDAKIAALLPELLTQKEKFRLSDSKIFSSEDDWLAILEYAFAMAAMEKGDSVAFKQHITEAFWLSPNQGAAFASHIERIRLAAAMKNVRLDFKKTYPSLFTEKPIRLEEILSHQKALLLHFWSPLSEECQANIGDFLITARHLEEKGIAVASVLPETSSDVLSKAKHLLESSGKKISGAWLIDSKNESLSELLRIKTIPVVLMISPEGAVLFHGHPTEREFWEKLEAINPNIERPGSKEEE